MKRWFIWFWLTCSFASFGFSALDPHGWLETLSSPKVDAWVKQQNDRTRKALASGPEFQSRKNTILGILESDDRIPRGNIRRGYVYNFWQDRKQVRGIWRRTPVKSYLTKEPRWEVILDLDLLSKKESKAWVFKGAECFAPEYHRCLLRLSDGGTDAVEVREFDIASRTFVSNGFFLPAAKSNYAWVDKDTLLVATDFGKGSLTASGYPRLAKLWKRGTPLSQAKVVYEGKHSDNGVYLWALPVKGKTYVGLSRYLTFFTAEHFLWQKEQLNKVALPNHATIEAAEGNFLIARIRKKWARIPKGSVLGVHVKLAMPQIIFSPGKRMSVNGIGHSQSGLWISYSDNLKSKAIQVVWEKNQWRKTQVDIPDSGRIEVFGGNPDDKGIFFLYQDYLTPKTLYFAQEDSPKVKVIKQLPAQFHSGDLVSVQKEAISKDGTKVPYFVVHKKGLKLDGSHPTVLYGYGGFEISLLPYYSPVRGKIWLESGGVFAVANIRGGGEFGPEWHQAALKQNRPRAYEDFIAVAEDLIRTKVTSSKKLGIQGGSNGGLLVGVAFTKRPDLFQGVLCELPLLDMLRYTQLPPGQSWAGEYGDPKKKEMRQVLASYSPYHNLRPKTQYPEVFFYTSSKDDRVHPGHARKMADRMQKLGHPVFFYENQEGGHGVAHKKQFADMLALEYGYLFRVLGRRLGE